MKNIIKVVIYDFKRFFYGSIWKYSALFIYVFFSSEAFYRKINRLILEHKINADVSVMDCFIYIFRGVRKLMSDNAFDFDIPVNFILLNLFFIFLVGNYITKDINGGGEQILIKTGSRHIWWVSKCITCFIGNLITYLVIIIAVTASGIINGATMGLGLNDGVLKVIYSADNIGQCKRVNIYICFILFIAIFTISLLQMFIELIFNSVMAVIFIMADYIISIYFVKEIFIGNQLMLLRYNYIAPDGISCYNSLIYDVLLISVCIICGCIISKKKEFY